MKLSKYIDHTSLSPDVSISKIKDLCKEAIDNEFMSVCVNPCFVSLCKNELKDSDVKVCTVVGFPLGANTLESKVFEAKDAINNGADEIDMVINISRLKNNDLDYVTSEIRAIKKAIGDNVLKVIIETCLLSDEEKINACKCVIDGNADFVKTSTGFSSGGATIEDVKLLKKYSENKILVKAAGGIKTSKDMLDMIEAGANRIGTSRGVSLIKA